MADLKGPKKDIKKVLKRQEGNHSILNGLKILQKKDTQELSSKLDKAVKTSVIHQNQANRQKSAIAKYIFAAG